MPLFSSSGKQEEFILPMVICLGKRVKIRKTRRMRDNKNMME